LAGHHLGRDQVVDREPVFSGQESEAAGQGDPADAGCRRVAESGCEAVLARRLGVSAGSDSSLRASGPALDVDLDRVHRGEVDDDPAFGRAVPRSAVAAAPDCELSPRLPCQGHDAGDVGCIGDAHDRRGPNDRSR
jgi:hypothetical protein